MRSAITILFLSFTWLINPQIVHAESLNQEANGTIYTVQPGDYLSQIARDQLGDAKAWPQIVAATNEQAASDSRFTIIQNPQHLSAGQLLWIPREDVSPPTGPILPLPPVDPPIISQRVELYPLSINRELFGYVNVNGDYLIEPQYVIAGDFHEGLAAVSADGKLFGFIDATGEMVIPAVFGNVGYFSNGLAAAMPEGSFFSNMDTAILSGYIDQAGEWSIPPQFLRVEPFHDGVARVLDEEYHTVYIDVTGATLRRASVPISFASDYGTSEGRPPSYYTGLFEKKSGICQNSSAYLQHPAVWRCEAENVTYDPCFVNENNVDITCQDPFLLQGSSFVAQTLEEPIVLGESLIGGVRHMWLDGVGTEKSACVHLYGENSSSSDAVQANPSDDSAQNNISPTQVAEGISEMATYRCSDGSFLMGEPWYVPQRRLWFVTKLADSTPSGAQSSQVVSVDRLIDLTTEVVLDGGGPSDIIPLGIYFLQY